MHLLPHIGVLTHIHALNCIHILIPHQNLTPSMSHPTCILYLSYMFHSTCLHNTATVTMELCNSNIIYSHIPRNVFSGWFQIVDENTGSATEHGCDTLDDVIGTNLSKILLIREPASGFKEDPTTGSLLAHMVNPGEILHISNVWTKEWKVAASKDAVPSTKLLKCFDLMHNVVHIPVAHPGKPFSLVGGIKDTSNPKLVYQIRNVIEFWKPGTIIKLVFGWPPQGLPEFHGYVRVSSINRPDCAIVYNFRNGKDVFLEIPLDVNIKVQMAENQQDFIKCDAYQDVLEICQKKIYPYVVNVKVSNIPYSPLKIEHVTGDNGEPGVKILYNNNAKNQKNINYMCIPRDMNLFHSDDVYPPVSKHYVSDTWKIVYRDPEHIYDDYKAIDMGSQGETNTEEPLEFPDDQTMLQHVFLQMTLYDQVGGGGDGGSQSSKISVHSRSSTGTRSSRKSLKNIFDSATTSGANSVVSTDSYEEDGIPHREESC